MEKKLYKSSTNKIVDGVCGGLGEYFNVDPVIVRIVFVILIFWGGVGIVLYIIGMLIIPESPEAKKEKEMAEKLKKDATEIGKKANAAAQQIAAEANKKFGNKNGAQVFGLILIGLGLFFMLQTVFPWIDFGNFWWLILIGLGVMLLLTARKE